MKVERKRVVKCENTKEENFRNTIPNSNEIKIMKNLREAAFRLCCLFIDTYSCLAQATITQPKQEMTNFYIY